MLRLTELKLPLGHDDDALRAALLKRLAVGAGDLIEFKIFRRGVDARKPAAIVLTYTLDVAVKNEAAVLKRFARDRNVAQAPDMDYRFVTHAPKPPARRPVVIGAGPCGLFAALILA